MAEKHEFPRGVVLWRLQSSVASISFRPLSAYEYILQRDECMKFMLGISTNYVVRYMC